MLQNPSSTQQNVWEALQAVYKKGYKKEVNKLLENKNPTSSSSGSNNTSVLSPDLQWKARVQALNALWHGTSAGIMKTVPKYCTAVLVKNAFDNYYKYENPITDDDLDKK